MPGCRWTQSEDATLRAGYASRGLEGACVAVPARSALAVSRRACALRLVPGRAWSADDDTRLRMFWDGDTGLPEIAQRLERTEMAIYVRAAEIGLPLGCPDGWEYLTEASRRTGFEPTTLRKILNAGGATIRRALAKPVKSRAKNGAGHPHFIVSPSEVDTAVADWLAAETVAEAAERLGIAGATLRHWLRQAGIERKRPGGRPRLNSRPHWRVSPEEIELAIAHRATARAA